jgi:hypothetical protein
MGGKGKSSMQTTDMHLQGKGINGVVIFQN